MAATVQSNKTKTKAKQRYLKVKKERRKKKKAATVEALHKNNVKTKLASSRGEVSRSHKEMQEEVSEPENKSDEMVTAPDHLEKTSPKSQRQAPPEKIDEGTNRPRKRRRVSQEPDESDSQRSASPSAATSSSETSSPSEQKLGGAPSGGIHPSSAAPLAAFPIPSVPNSISQKTLALQGLDPGLVDAEIIDAARTVSIDSSDSETSGPTLGLSLKTRKRLKELGIIELFAVQTALLPFLLPASPSKRALYMPYNAPRDICVSAPTGSGKTLAYVLPILELLSKRVVTRLRALIVLPTRDLVVQVRETFDAVCKGRGLKIGTATGQHSFIHEQAQLVEDSSTFLQGGSSKIDILICTPGRLIDHLNGTPNFSLQHLRFLVIDEADRLLTQSFQDWLAQVLSATRPPVSSSSDFSHTPSGATTIINSASTVAHHDAVSPAWLPFPEPRSHVDEKREVSCQKLLFSATLTRDPSKIAALELRDAKYFIVKDAPRDGAQDGHIFARETFTFPATLSEHMIICTSVLKPLVLFHLVHNHGVSDALVFTKSAESTARLVKLFECFERARGSGPGSPKACAYSSDLSTAERRTILEKFKSKEITILVCSDLISRGIDISHVSHVVSYDAPVDMRKYVHRVGRTARAGRAGDAWSLIEEHEARYFKRMLGEADHLTKVRKMRVTEEGMKASKDHYETALKAYKRSDDS